MCNDINYLFKYKKKIIILYIFLSLMSVSINMNSSVSIENIIMLSFGSNLRFDSIGVLEIGRKVWRVTGGNRPGLAGLGSGSS